MFKRVLALIWKEFLAVIKDPRSRLSILLPPIVQLFIFVPASTLDVKNIPIAILNEDSGAEAFELIQRFRGSSFFSQIHYLQNVQEIAPFIENQRVVMVIAIDEQFSRKLHERLPASLQLILDGRKSNTAQIVLGYTTTIVQRYQDDFAAKNGIPQENVKLMPRYWYNPNANYNWYNIPSLVSILTMVVCLSVTAQSVARERELGTFDQLLVSPLGTWEILLGKMVPGIVIGMLEGIFLLIVGRYAFQVPFVGSLPLFLLSQFVFVCAVSGFGLFISSLCSTQQQAMLGTSVLLLPSVLLSGFATPIENMPPWLQPVTYLIPLRYMLINAKGIFLKDMSAEAAFANIWPMILIAIFTLSTGGLFFRKRFQ